MNLPERVEIAPRDLLPRVEFDPEAPASVDPAVLATVAKAVAANQVLRVTYRPLGQDNPRQYVLDPYLVRRARGAWYLVGRDHRSGHVPIFNLTRMQKVEPTGETFDYAASGFDPARYFAATFGAYEAPGRHRVRLEFRGTGAELVRERRWQPSQKLTDRPGGKVRLELEVSHLDDVWPWVLSWGSMAKVLAPKELADLVAEQAAGTLRNYRAGRHS